MLTLGWGGSGGAAGVCIVVVLVSSVACMGVVATPEEVLLSLPWLEVGGPVITSPSRRYSSRCLHVPASSSLSYIPVLFSAIPLLHSRTLQLSHRRRRSPIGLRRRCGSLAVVPPPWSTDGRRYEDPRVVLGYW
ncbi:hypothetical protein EDD85DRAFT_855373 [Armillaria nabsnona]|nr:hypothetical protein EDD85DRAFT_855373 [Armillaria nabsnona]